MTEGAICGGGDKKAAWKYIRGRHCEKHKRQSLKCEACCNLFEQAIDECFMTIM